MIRGLGVALIFAAACLPQATVPQFAAPVALPGDAARKPAVVVIDAPLAFTRDPATNFVHLSTGTFIVDPPLTVIKDAAGQMHLSVEFPDVQAAAHASPVIGSPCDRDAVIQWDRAFVYVCIPPATLSTVDARIGWTWAGAALQAVATAQPSAAVKEKSK